MMVEYPVAWELPARMKENSMARKPSTPRRLNSYDIDSNLLVWGDWSKSKYGEKEMTAQRGPVTYVITKFGTEYNVTREQTGMNGYPLGDFKSLIRAKQESEWDYGALMRAYPARHRNPRASERGAPQRARGDIRSPMSLVPISPSIFDKKNWNVAYYSERDRADLPMMFYARLSVIPLYSSSTPFENRAEAGRVRLDEPLHWGTPIPMRVGTWDTAIINWMDYLYTPDKNLLEVRYHVYMGLEFDPVFGEEIQNELVYVVYYGTPKRRPLPEEAILEEHTAGPRGLEEAVKMARSDFEKRMRKGDIQRGTTRPRIISRNETVFLAPHEAEEVRLARMEAMRVDENDKMVHKLTPRIRGYVQRLRPDRVGGSNFGEVYRREVDFLLEWYRSLPRSNPSALTSGFRYRSSRR